MALGVLEENIINPRKEIHTIGYLSLPNPYDASNPTIFKDWKNHGSVDMRRAIAVSSDVYFYIVGGGFGDQKGLGIKKIDEYMTKFLFGVPVEGFFAGPAGLIPTPEWKEKTFNGDPWRIGNTYHTAIGQYGFQVTPMQMARAVTGIATEGTVVEPTIRKDEQGRTSTVGGTSEHYKIIKEGMRLAVTEETAIALNIPGVSVAGKTGTAEIGANKDRVNSWVEGFFPYDNPKYAFALVLESGPTTYQVSSMRAMAEAITWMRDNTPEYVQ
jgi:penicillin-binding protein 2